MDLLSSVRLLWVIAFTIFLWTKFKKRLPNFKSPEKNFMRAVQWATVGGGFRTKQVQRFGQTHGWSTYPPPNVTPPNPH